MSTEDERRELQEMLESYRAALQEIASRAENYRAEFNRRYPDNPLDLRAQFEAGRVAGWEDAVRHAQSMVDGAAMMRRATEKATGEGEGS